MIEAFGLTNYIFKKKKKDMEKTIKQEITFKHKKKIHFDDVIMNFKKWINKAEGIFYYNAKASYFSHVVPFCFVVLLFINRQK